jgi:hypothetical protein
MLARGWVLIVVARVWVLSMLARVLVLLGGLARGCTPINVYAHLNIYIYVCRRLFHDEIKAGADDGRCANTLYSMMRLVAIHWCPEMQEVEGINGVLQRVATRAPHISLCLLDARVAVRKTMGMGYASQPKKWSDVQEHVLATVGDACEHADQTDDVLGDATRWSRTEAAATMPLPAQARLDVSEAALHSQQALGWGQHNSRVFMLAWSAALADKPDLGVSVLTRPGTSVAWVCCMRYARSGHLLKCTIAQGAEPGFNRVEIVKPIQVKSSLFVFAGLYGDYAHGGALSYNLCEMDLGSHVSEPLATILLEAPPPRPTPTAGQPAALLEDAPGGDLNLETALAEVMGLSGDSQDDDRSLAEGVDAEQTVRNDVGKSHALHENAHDFDTRVQRALQLLYPQEPSDMNNGERNGDEDAHIAAELEDTFRLLSLLCFQSETQTIMNICYSCVLHSRLYIFCAPGPDSWC